MTPLEMLSSTRVEFMTLRDWKNSLWWHFRPGLPDSGWSRIGFHLLRPGDILGRAEGVVEARVESVPTREIGAATRYQMMVAVAAEVMEEIKKNQAEHS